MFLALLTYALYVIQYIHKGHMSITKLSRGEKMPRPRKCKKVCCLPENNLFGPINVGDIYNEVITMTVDEYETIRLIDLEEMTQEECAYKMNVARTTIQRIYNDARKKLAKSLVEGKRIQIGGGDYKLCGENGELFRCKRCHKRKCLQDTSENTE